MKKIIKKIKNNLYNLFLMLRNGHYLKQFGFFLSRNEIPVYWWSGKGNKNFGDIITPYLVEKISDKKVIWVNKHCFREHYMVTGSILPDANKNSIVWGSGIMSKQQKIKKPKRICAVRGPLTRKRLLEIGYSCPEIYGDPALLLPLFYKCKNKKKYELGIIPHHADYFDVKKNAHGKKLLIINLFDPVEKVIKEICSCKRILSSSLHGIIVSHTYDIPSVWIELSNNVGGDGTKFKDYFLSVGIKEYAPLLLNIPKLKINEIIKIIDKEHNYKINFNKKRLLDSCPFRIKKSLI